MELRITPAKKLTPREIGIIKAFLDDDSLDDLLDVTFGYDLDTSEVVINVEEKPVKP